MEGQLHVIEQAVGLVEQGSGGTTELNTLRTCLIDMLAHLERDPGIEAAADDLYDVAAALVSESADIPHATRLKRLLRDAEHRLRERLTTAVPKER